MDYFGFLTSWHKEHIEKKPIYIFVGKEDYLKSECLGILKEFLKIPPHNIVRLKSLDLTQLNNELFTYTLMGEKKLIVLVDEPVPVHKPVKIKNGEQKKVSFIEANSKWFLDYAQSPSSITTLVLFTETMKTVKLKGHKNCLVVDCRPLEGQSLIRWITQIARRYNKQIEVEAIKDLITLCGNNLWTLASEIEKISTYIGKREIILTKDITQLTTGKPKPEIFDLAKAIVKRDISKSHKIFDILVTGGESIPGIVGMIAWQVRELSDARTIDVQRIKEMNRLIMDADLALKTTAISDRIICENLIYKLTRS
jgi:DNA polymerase-3 subunit delta